MEEIDVSNPLLSIYADPKYKNKTGTQKRISTITEEVEPIEYANFCILKVKSSFSSMK